MGQARDSSTVPIIRHLRTLTDVENTKKTEMLERVAPVCRKNCLCNRHGQRRPMTHRSKLQRLWNDGGPHAASRRMRVWLFHNLHPSIVGAQISSRVVYHHQQRLYQLVLFWVVRVHFETLPTNQEDRFKYACQEKNKQTAAQANKNRCAKDVCGIRVHLVVL